MFSNLFSNMSPKSNFVSDRLTVDDAKYYLAVHYYFISVKLFGSSLLNSYLENRIAYLLGHLSSTLFKFPSYSGIVRSLKFFENGVIEIAAATNRGVPLPTNDIFVEAAAVDLESGLSNCYEYNGKLLAVTNDTVKSFSFRFDRGHGPFCSLNGEVMQCLVDGDNWSKYTHLLYSNYPVCDCEFSFVVSPKFKRCRFNHSLALFVKSSSSNRFNYSSEKFLDYFDYLSLGESPFELTDNVPLFNNAVSFLGSLTLQDLLVLKSVSSSVLCTPKNSSYFFYNFYNNCSIVDVIGLS